MKPLFRSGEIRFGLGLIGIGKPWGHVPGTVPSDADARRLLDFAFEAGIRYFDSAPSYGCAEQRLGEFLRSLTAEERASVTVATKFGEHWDSAPGRPFVDHSYAALARSLEASIGALRSIDVLQLHKTTPEVLRSDDLHRAWELAREQGINVLGASVSDLESARVACADGAYQMLQMPFNLRNRKFDAVFAKTEASGMWVATNRPYAMGELVESGASLVGAFEFVAVRLPRGVVLSGTKSVEHLRENLRAFEEATACRSGAAGRKAN